MVILISNAQSHLTNGAYDSNDKGLVQGQLDIPLNNHGRSQIERLAKHCRLVPFNRIYTSNLSRAVEVRLLRFHSLMKSRDAEGGVERRDHCETPGTRRSCHKSRAEGSTLWFSRRGTVG